MAVFRLFKSMRSVLRHVGSLKWHSGICFAMALLMACLRLNAEETSALAPLFRAASGEYRKLDESRAVLAAESQSLPVTTLNQQSERLGFQIWHSKRAPEVESVWVEVDLGKAQPLDGVVLVPVDAPYRGSAGPAYGFPVRFRVEVRADMSALSEVIADHTAEDFPNPGALPVWLPTQGKVARIIRVTMTKPWRPPEDLEIFALGEIMAIRGNYNIAAGLPPNSVTASETFESLRVWSKSNLIDGHSILGAPSSGGAAKNLGFHSAMADRADDTKWVQVDLGESIAIDEVRLIGARVSQFPGRPGFGFPVRFKVEASDDETFTKSIMIVDETKDDFINPASNPVTLRCNGLRARFVRVTATRLWERAENFAFCLAELQIYAGGTNIALGKPVTALDHYPSARGYWDPVFLTDGYSSESHLGEWPDWVQGLSRRREALLELANVNAQLSLTHERMRSVLDRGVIASGILILAGISVGLIRLRLTRQRELEQLRQRIASDLHDDIGSNLGNIALLSEIVAEQSAGEMREDVQEIHCIAQQTADSMRDIVWLIQRPTVTAEDLVQRLRNIASRTLTGIEWNLTAEALRGMPTLDSQRHLVLAFKEVLHNIRKHAEARQVEITLSQTATVLALGISDDGVGFDSSATYEGHGLASLRQRAIKLGGELRITTAPSEGTRIVLTAKL